VLRSVAGIVPLLLLLLAGCTQTPDASPPDSVAPFVDAAREALRREDDRHRDFAFRSARCREDGGVVLLFEQYGAASEGLAVALSGAPAADPGVWAGGFASIDPATDPEIRAFFEARREVRCT